MLVKFKRDFFGPGAVLYPKGTVEYNGKEELLPRDAIIVSEGGRLPIRSPQPKPGFGAKPLEEQVLDLIPGAAPTHQIEPAEGAAPPELSEDEKKAKEAEASKVREVEDKEKAKEQDKVLAEEKKEVEAGVKAAEKAAEKVEEVIDPVFASTKKK